MCNRLVFSTNQKPLCVLKIFLTRAQKPRTQLGAWFNWLGSRQPVRSI